MTAPTRSAKPSVLRIQASCSKEENKIKSASQVFKRAKSSTIKRPKMMPLRSDKRTLRVKTARLIATSGGNKERTPYSIDTPLKLYT